VPNTLSLQEVDGPIMEIVLNRFHVNAEATTVMELIEQIQSDQLEVMEHAHVSHADVIAALQRGDHQGCPEDAALFDDSLRRQCFNWFSDMEACVAI
jgi:hypothetical protein